MSILIDKNCSDCNIIFKSRSHNHTRCKICQRKQRSKIQNISHRFDHNIKTCKTCRMHVDCPLREKGHHRCQFYIPAEWKDYFINDIDWFPIMNQAGVFQLFTPEEIRSDRL